MWRNQAESQPNRSSDLLSVLSSRVALSKSSKSHFPHLYNEDPSYRTVRTRDNQYTGPEIIDIINLLYNFPTSFPRLAMIDSDLISLIL